MFIIYIDFPDDPGNAGELRDTGSIPGSGRSPEGVHGNPLEDFCLENPMDKGTWGQSIGSKRVVNN